jgi:predicted amidohydrolase YtcJ
MLVTGADVVGHARRVDVRIDAGRVVEIGERLTLARGEQRVSARGDALLPGLHDHHLHLYAMAAADASIRVGPREVGDERGLRAALTAATPGWVRAVGYHESVAGDLDRDRLDALVADRPVRVQHRSGALWMLNSAAIRATGLEDVADPAVERDRTGRVTGRLWRWDAALRDRLPPEPAPDLGRVSRRLGAYGITGVTDATPDLDAATLSALGAAAATGTLSQRLVLLGAPLGAAAPPGVEVGPYKLLLPDHDLPSWSELVERIGAAHAVGRPVAVHCVTREALLLTVAALDVDGRPGDRIEHAGVVPPETRADLARLGVRVVTQPGFLADRGDAYLRDVEPEDRELLYPYASLCAAGVPVAPSSDAPYGPENPWEVIAAARDRLAPGGQVVTRDERVIAAQALDGYLSPADAPGGPPRRVVVGATADLVLLDRPLAVALADPAATGVRLTLSAGRPIDTVLAT